MTSPAPVASSESATEVRDHRARSHASLRETYLATMPSALGFAHLVIFAVVGVFWRQTSPSLLVSWGALVSLVMLTSSLLVKKTSTRRFLPIAFVGETVAAICWALLPVIALPAEPDWQALQGVLLVGLILSTLGNSTSSRSLHLASTVPLGLVGAVVFTVQGTGGARFLSIALGIALPFTLASGAVLRRVQSDLFESSLKNEDLAADLRAERDRLTALNDQLELANSDLDAQSKRDALTGLYNRTGFLDLVNKAVETDPGKVVVCYLDIDGFKRVNDAFGHRFGDLILCAAARRILSVLRPGEVIARQGGDELIIFSTIDKMASGPADLGERLLSVFVEPFVVDGRQIGIGVSVGLAWLEEPTSSHDLMRFADAALYKAKNLGGQRYQIFDTAMRSELERRSQLQTDLGDAFVGSEIKPYLQPIVHVNTGKIATAEALARWEHQGEVRPAASFIDTARDLGMLDRINEIVVHEVFDFQRMHRASGTRSCPITVNVSPMHLEAMLNRVLAEPDLDPVIIEITEDGIFSDLDGARALLSRARDAGIGVLLDDFGVGFSSLSIATELPIDGFKIDRGFVASLEGNPSALAAVEAIIQLARRMKLHVIAEGVETVSQLRLLRDLGVDFVQGYLFSEAVTMEVFSHWLATDHHFDVHASTAQTEPTLRPSSVRVSQPAR